MVREFLAVLVRAALQWALASLLLANGAAFCLIAAAASSLRLGPPCLLCARVHRLLCSDCGQEEQDAFRRLLCDAHVAAIARLGAQETEQPACSASHHVNAGTKYDSDKPRGLESHRVVSIGSEICEQDRAGDDDQPRAAATNLSILGRTSSTDSGEGPYVSLFELTPLVALPEDTPPDYDAKETPHGHGHGTTTKPEHDESAAAGGEQALTVSGLVAALRTQRRELEAARAELHGERRARAELEEQGELDREAARVAMQLVHETETEKHELQRQLDAFRVRAQLHGHEAAAASLDADYSAPPANRLGRRLSRDGDGESIDQEDEAGWSGGKNYQSLVDFLPGSVYSSSPDLANLLRLYTEGNGNGAHRPKEGGITEEEEEVVVVAVTAAAVSGFDGGDGEASSIAAGAGASLPDSGSDHVGAGLAQDEAAAMRA